MKPWDGGAIEAWGVGYPHERISSLVPLRIGMSRELDHRTLRTHHSSLFGRGTDGDVLGQCDLGIPYERYLWRVHVR